VTNVDLTLILVPVFVSQPVVDIVELTVHWWWNFRVQSLVPAMAPVLNFMLLITRLCSLVGIAVEIRVKGALAGEELTPAMLSILSAVETDGIWRIRITSQMVEEHEAEGALVTLPHVSRFLDRLLGIEI